LDLGKFGWIWAKLKRNLGKIEVKFGQKWLYLGKIKILHPQKHSISYGYGEAWWAFYKRWNISNKDPFNVYCN